MGTNGKFFLINAHGVLRRMGAVTEIPGTVVRVYSYCGLLESKYVMAVEVNVDIYYRCIV